MIKMEQEKIDWFWLAGFFDADGSVIGTARVGKSRKLGFRIDPEIQFKQGYLRYLAGFTDGDGHIRVKTTVDKSYKIGFRLRPEYNLDNCSAQMMNDIYNRLKELGFKPNRAIIKTPSRTRPTWRPICQIRISRRSLVKRFCRMILPYLHLYSPKRTQIGILLDEIIPRLEQGVHSTKEGFIEVMHYVDKMNQLKGGKRGKYSEQYFRQLWGVT